MKSRIKAVICVLSAFFVLIGFIYVNDYYRATDRAIEASEEAYYLDDNVLVFNPDSEVDKVDEIDKSDISKEGIIFYPGGKVEYTAYAPLMEACAAEGIVCVLVHMPCNLAVFNVNAAEGIQEQVSEVEEWYMAGHSLGGSMAASYIGEHAEEFKGLILLASYSTEDLSETELDVLSIFGTEDLVLNEEKYEEYKSNLPKGYSEEIINGGCHAYFGDYGEQEGDGLAEISLEEQQKITVEAIKNFVK